MLLSNIMPFVISSLKIEIKIRSEVVYQVVFCCFTFTPSHTPSHSDVSSCHPEPQLDHRESLRVQCLAHGHCNKWIGGHIKPATPGSVVGVPSLSQMQVYDTFRTRSEIEGAD